MVSQTIYICDCLGEKGDKPCKQEATHSEDGKDYCDDCPCRPVSNNDKEKVE